MLGSLVSPESMGVNFMDMTVLEKQQARMRWVEQQHHTSHLPPQFLCSLPQFPNSTSAGDLVQLKLHGANQGMSDFSSFGNFQVAGAEFASDYDMGLPSLHDPMDGCISRTNSCKMMEEGGGSMTLTDKIESVTGTNSSKKKRKTEAFRGDIEEDCRGGKIKREEETESSVKAKSINNKTEVSSDTSKENSKVSDVQKPDYIHVRARRGEATDKHSLAERARREKISKKMKYLQDLVPGCNKITGKAGMLDEIINYVQSLQRQVEFLSMKLAVMNPAPGFGFEGLESKAFPAYTAKLPAGPKPPEQLDSLASNALLDLPLLSLNQTETQENTLSHKLPSSSTWEVRQQSLYDHRSFGYHY